MSAPITIEELEAVLAWPPAPITIEELEAVLAWPPADPADYVEFLEDENLRLTVELEDTQGRLRGIMTACFAG